MVEKWETYFEKLLKEQHETVKRLRTEGWYVEENPQGLGYIMWRNSNE